MAIKKISIISLLLGVFSLLGCARNKSLQEKINALMGMDYSEFSHMSIVDRKGVYFVAYKGITYKIKERGTAKKISSINVAFEEGKKVLLTEKDIGNIERGLKSFERIEVLALSVDRNGNVLLSLPWYDGCTYYLLKLSSNNTLEDLKKQYYRNYKDNWYIYEECSKMDKGTCLQVNNGGGETDASSFVACFDFESARSIPAIARFRLIMKIRDYRLRVNKGIICYGQCKGF